MNIPDTTFMKVAKLELNDKTVYVLDAPENSTHGKVEFNLGVNYVVCRKNKPQHRFIFDKHVPNDLIVDKYEGKLVNVGMLKVADESLVADLFVPMKNGNFYDYEHNGVFYPKALGALRDIIDVQFGFKNPFVLIVNP
jgi:hypothetical protein